MLVPVQDAYRRVIDASRPLLQHESVPLCEATGRVLAEDIFTDRDLPPFHRVAMDGIVIRFDDFTEGTRRFKVCGVQAAGDPSIELPPEKGSCLEIMTGASLSPGGDVVIPYERIVLEDGIAEVSQDVQLDRWQNIHLQGADARKGTLVLNSGSQINCAALGALASVGAAQIKVQKMPRIAFFATGNELVDIDQSPEPHQIRKSNGAAIQSLLEGFGFTVEVNSHLKDERNSIFDRLADSIDKFDLIMLSGGVSKGKYDYVPDILSDLRVHRIFHGVAQRPGKPFWFGQSDKGTLVAGLPGNPVSSFVTVRRYLIPCLQKLAGLDVEVPHKKALAEDVSFSRDLALFQLVKISTQDRATVIPISGQGSGDFMSLIHSDGFVELPAHQNQFQNGEEYPFYAW